MTISPIMPQHIPDIVKVVEIENRGVRPLDLARIAIGVVLKGSKEIYHNDHSVRVSAGEMFVMAPALHYEENIVMDESFEQIVFYASVEALQRVEIALTSSYGLSYEGKHRCAECDGKTFAIGQPTPAIADLFQAVARSLRRNELKGDDVGRQIKFNELVYLLLSEGEPCMRSLLVNCSDVVNNAFAREIYNNVFSDASIETLARKTNRSLTSFKKEFRRQFSESPHRWFIDQRLQRAKILLLSTNMTVSEIGNECAFTNISHFIKLFKQRFHDTPASMRRLALTSADETLSTPRR